MNIRRFKTTLGVFTFIIFLFIVLSNWYIVSFSKNKIYSSFDEVTPAEVALVFGGGMKKDGITMSEMQTDRVTQSVNLYKAGKVKKIIMTGDDGANNSNEVAAMSASAIANGVPPEAVLIDPHGYNTFKSCQRAITEYGVTSTIAVSQKFHLSRIVYYCSHQGMEVKGLAADLREYGFWKTLWPQDIREWLARAKAVVSARSERVGNVVVY